MKRIFPLFVVFMMLFSFTACDGFRLFISQNGGIQELSFYKQNNKVCLNAEYFGCEGYHVEILEADDVIIKGEQPVPFQSLIGENAIKISLIETKFDRLLDVYDTFVVYNVSLEGTDMKFMLCPSPEHSLYVYVGFADNIKALATERTNINIPFGTIHLELGEYI